jgi:hypothetical protein
MDRFKKAGRNARLFRLGDITAIIECDSACEFSITYRFTKITMLFLLAGRRNAYCHAFFHGKARDWVAACPVAASPGGLRFSKLAFERMG